ncbi:MAG: addiction module protein [Bacteroidota bacterium]
MSEEYQKVLAQAKALSKEEFISLVQVLLSEVQEIITMDSTEKESEDLIAELDMRVASIRSGEIQAIPGEIVMEKLKKRINS